jgi:hypothetical protein
MGEDGRAVALDMLVEPDTGTGLGQDRCERGLASGSPSQTLAHPLYSHAHAKFGLSTMA